MKAGVIYELSLRAPWVWARGICFSANKAKSRSLGRRGNLVMTNVINSRIARRALYSQSFTLQLTDSYP